MLDAMCMPRLFEGRRWSRAAVSADELHQAGGPCVTDAHAGIRHRAQSVHAGELGSFGNGGDSLSTCRETIIYPKACKKEATKSGRSPMQFDD